MKCPHCSGRLIQRDESGGARLRVDGPLTASASGVVTARCFWCKAAVEMPMALDVSTIPAPTPVTVERVVVRARKDA